MHFICFIRFRKYLLVSIWKNLLEISLTGRNSSLELKIKKRYIIIGIFIVILILILSIIIKKYKYNENLWYEKWNQTMELLGEALINQDIELMDELFDPECTIYTTGREDSKYSYEREVIEEAWNTNDFMITSYKYGTLGWSSGSAICTFEIEIVDANGDEYEWNASLHLNRKGSYDNMNCIITQITSHIYKHT